MQFLKLKFLICYLQHFHSSNGTFHEEINSLRTFGFVQKIIGIFSHGCSYYSY
jgi:UDP-3-O-acyl-N-acetylglucosamine deacetylase